MLERQAPPQLQNQFDDDVLLRSYLARVLPEETLRDIEPSLRVMGALTCELATEQLRDRRNEPVLTHFDAWGARIDHIEVSPLWRRAARLAAEHGLVAAAYEPRHGAFARIHQFALAYLFMPSTDVYACPLAMTDGAAATLLASGNRTLIERAVPRLTTRDPDFAWTSGQWMTELTGGSDVGASETVAKPDGTTWRLYGRKWFTSATTADMALTLARPEGNPGGGHGLALFYVEPRDAHGRLQRLVVHRLKDKLGTRKVPTAELGLEGTPATLVGETTFGTRAISPMLNVTRTWNAVSAIALMRRSLALATSYARARTAFGAHLIDKPLHVETLADAFAELHGAFLLTFRVVELLGRHDRGELAASEERLLRVLTPIAKLLTGKQAVEVVSEAIEAFGGAGYVEDTGLPTLLRDAHVLPIWEGTTNVLSLDVLKLLSHPNGEAAQALEAELARATGAGVHGETRHDPLTQLAELARRTAATAVSQVRQLAPSAPDLAEGAARRIAVTLGRSLSLGLLIEHARATGAARDAAAVRRYAARGIDWLAAPSPDDARCLLGGDGG